MEHWQHIDTSRCYVCDRPFNGRSKPVWVARPTTGIILGVAHTTCAHLDKLRRVWPADASIEGAQFEAWHDMMYDRRLADRDLYAAMLLGAEPPAEQPTPNQIERIEHWSRPHSHIGAALAHAAWARYRELCAEYAAWLAEQA